MTPAELARSLKAAHPTESAGWISTWMRTGHGVLYSRQAVEAALRAKSIRRGRPLLTPRCPTCGALACHARKHKDAK